MTATDFNADVIYTAGRLAERRVTTRFSWHKLVFKSLSYLFVCASFSLIQSGFIVNKPRYTTTTIFIAIIGLAWESYGFFKSNSERQKDENSLRAAGYKLIGFGTNIVIIESVKDVSKAITVRKLKY